MAEDGHVGIDGCVGGAAKRVRQERASCIVLKRLNGRDNKGVWL